MRGEGEGSAGAGPGGSPRVRVRRPAAPPGPPATVEAPDGITKQSGRIYDA